MVAPTLRGFAPTALDLGRPARVFVAGDCGSLTVQTIRTGRASDGMVELVARLDSQETIVAGGALFIDRAAKGD